MILMEFNNNINMKNISGKTMIFYTFQDSSFIKEPQYNVTTFKKSAPTQIKIRDVLFQLPLDYENQSYHFRFKSQFFEGQDKVIGWIDISNLLAKVPVINNCVFVKILIIQNHQYNKLFSRDKLKAVGLIDPNADTKQKKEKVTNGNTKSNNLIQQMEQIIPLTPKTNGNINKNVSETPSENQNGDFIDFSPSKKGEQGQDTKKPFKRQTPQEMHAAYLAQLQGQEREAQEQKIAARQLDEKINEWGYSGLKTINNLTTLLATLHTVWPQWQPVSLSDMLNPDDVQAKLKKAVIKVHPDKNRRKDFRTKYLAKRVFQLLNEAKKAQQTNSS